jgi:hypothetical protein
MQMRLLPPSSLPPTMLTRGPQVVAGACEALIYHPSADSAVS